MLNVIAKAKLSYTFFHLYVLCTYCDFHLCFFYSKKIIIQSFHICFGNVHNGSIHELQTNVIMLFHFFLFWLSDDFDRVARIIGSKEMLSTKLLNDKLKWISVHMCGKNKSLVSSIMAFGAPAKKEQSHC